MFPVNVTFQLDDELVRRAKLVAARRNTSISAVVRQGLEQQVAMDESLAKPGAHGSYEALVNYSLGRAPRRVTMDLLGLDDYADLLHMLGAAGLSQPIVPAAERATMVQEMLDVVRGAGVQVKKPRP
jgi:hypothetical protein